MTPTTQIKRNGDRWEVVIVRKDGYKGGLLCDTRAEARKTAHDIRTGKLTQY